MKVVLNVKESQLQGILEVLAGTAGTRDIIINIKEEEFRAKDSGLNTENLQQIQKIMDNPEDEEYPRLNKVASVE